MRLFHTYGEPSLIEQARVQSTDELRPEGPPATQREWLKVQARRSVLTMGPRYVFAKKADA